MKTFFRGEVKKNSAHYWRERWNWFQKGDHIIILDLPQNPSEEALKVISSSGGGLLEM